MFGFRRKVHGSESGGSKFGYVEVWPMFDCLACSNVGCKIFGPKFRRFEVRSVQVYPVRSSVFLGFGQLVY